MNFIHLALETAGAALLAGVVAPQPAAPSVRKKTFGLLPDGRKATLFTLKNVNGMEARITDFGGIVQALKVPDRNGKVTDVVIGYDKFEDYLRNPPYLGAAIGR